ncbi:cyclic di-AMP receptor DarA [soil metagenome]
MSKLIVAIVHDEDAGRLMSALRGAEVRVTRLRSSGGFLRSGNSTLILGLEDHQVGAAVALIEENCQARTEQVPIELLGGMDASWLPTEVTHGGATIFVLPIDEIRRI